MPSAAGGGRPFAARWGMQRACRATALDSKDCRDCSAGQRAMERRNRQRAVACRAVAAASRSQQAAGSIVPGSLRRRVCLCLGRGRVQGGGPGVCLCMSGSPMLAGHPCTPVAKTHYPDECLYTPAPLPPRPLALARTPAFTSPRRPHLTSPHDSAASPCRRHSCSPAGPLCWLLLLTPPTARPPRRH
jgi:hypothetical protein